MRVGECRGSDRAGTRPSVPPLSLKPRLHMRNPERFSLPPKGKERFGATPSGPSLLLSPLPHSLKPGLRERFVSKPNAGGLDLSLRSCSPGAAAGTGDSLGASREHVPASGGVPGLWEGASAMSLQDVPAGCPCRLPNQPRLWESPRCPQSAPAAFSHSIHARGAAGWECRTCRAHQGRERPERASGSPAGAEPPCADRNPAEHPWLPLPRGIYPGRDCPGLSLGKRAGREGGPCKPSQRQP